MSSSDIPPSGSAPGSTWSIGSSILRKIGAPSSEGYSQTAIDDPDRLNRDTEERWQEAVQRDDQHGTVFQPHQIAWQAALHQAEKDLRQRNEAERRRTAQRNPHESA